MINWRREIILKSTQIIDTNAYIKNIQKVTTWTHFSSCNNNNNIPVKVYAMLKLKIDLQSCLLHCWIYSGNRTLSVYECRLESSELFYLSHSLLLRNLRCLPCFYFNVILLYGFQYLQ